MNEIVYDASFLIGLIDEDDRWHEAAINIHRAIKEKSFNIIYLDCVANEVVSVLARRYERRGESETFRETILQKFKEIVQEEDLTWVYRDIEKRYKEVMELIEKHSGRLNFHDCLISLFMSKNNVPFIASFDKDFDCVDGIVRVKRAEDVETGNEKVEDS